MDLPLVKRNLSPAGMSHALRPLQNRVDPFGELHAVPERGGHDGQSRRAAASRRSDVERQPLEDQALAHLRLRVQGPPARRVGQRLYTELFFLDEPTALAAGHRPCFECRRQAAKAFIAAFPGAPSHVEAMDDALHRERVENRRKRLWRARLGDLPDGAMIARDRRALRRALGRAFAVELRRLWSAGAARSRRRRRRPDPALDRRRAQGRL